MPIKATESGEPNVSGSTDPTSAVLKTLVSRRKKSWIRAFVTVLAVSLAIGFFGFPQSFTSTVSIAMQQQTPGSGGLAGILSLGSLTKKYVGVLKSRNFIDRVEQQAHLKELYELKRHSELVDKYGKAVKFDDNATDGLIYISVTLDAPPLFALHSAERREKVRQATAIIGNGYHQALLHYLEYVDTDKELVLLRTADSEVNTSRLNYDIAMNRLVRFVKSRKIKPNAVPTMPSAASVINSGAPGSGTQDSTSAATQFLALFSKKAQLEAQITAAETLHQRLQKMLNSPLTDVASIPGEDPLLFESRRSYNDAHRTYETLRQQLGPENPRLISAQANSRIAENRLREQIRAVLAGNTTESLNLVTLKSTYSTVQRQVADAEKNFQTSRELTTDLGRLTSEVALNLKVLETAKTAAETLKMSTVAARNRMNVVDEAIPEDRSHPGKGMLIAISILIASALVGLWFALEYNIMLRASEAQIANEFESTKRA